MVNGKNGHKATNNNPFAKIGKVITVSKPDSLPNEPKFDQNVVLRQSPIWSRGIIWTIVGVTSFSLLWATFAKIEQVVPARGQLEPEGMVKDIKPPVNGVVREVLVEEGEKVEKGQVLVIFDTTASQAELESLESIRQAVSNETKFYRALINGPLTPAEMETALVKLDIPNEVAVLARNLNELEAENQMFRLYLEPNATEESQLSVDQRARLSSLRSEYESRSAAAELEVKQLQRELAQNQLDLSNTRARLATDQQVLEDIRLRNEKAIAQAEESLAIEQRILDEIRPLKDEGAIASIQLDRQQQEVNDRYQRLVEQRATTKIEYDQQQQEVQTRLAEIDKFLEEQQRLEFDIAQAQQQLLNTSALTERDIRQQLAENSQRVADIESQLMKLVVENDKRLAELSSQISQAKQTLKYQELRAPVAGTVFDLQASPGFVPQPSQAEVLMKIVPNDHLIAKVYISNENIGFVDENMNVDVRIDSFPFSEFGDIKGKVVKIGSDALPPDETYKFYRFPTEIALDSQELIINNKPIQLQSGMSVSANIKVRENRTVLSLFTELFSKKIESLKQVR